MDISGLLSGVAVIAEKNIRIYYNKPPVFIFGLLFPLLLFIAFYIGRSMDMQTFLPGFLAMTLFFTASSVGPLITPWEKRDRTFERLLSYPVTLEIILLGDTVAGALFGLIITAIIIAGTVILLKVSVAVPLVWCVATLLGAITFASLGALLASPASETPSNIMMLSSLVRFPLIFISGIFVPLSSLGGVGLYLATLSPLTYLVDIFSFGMHGYSVFNPVTDCIVLLAWTVALLVVSRTVQRRNLTKGL